MAKTLKKSALLVCGALAATCLSAGAVTMNHASADGAVTGGAATLTSSDFTNGIATLFTGNGDYTIGEEAAPDRVNGATTVEYATWGCGISKPELKDVYDVNDASEDAYFNFATMKEGAKDGHALAVKVDDFGLTTYPAVSFAKQVKVSEIASLTLRIYTNFNSDGTPCCGWNGSGFANDPGYSGIYLYSASNTTFDKGEGVLLNPNAKQREWTEVSISGRDLEKLADSNGYISGLRIGSAFMSGGPTQLYNGDWVANVSGQAYDKCASFFIDEITVDVGATIDAETGKAVLMTGNGDYDLGACVSKVEGMDNNSLADAWGGAGMGWAYNRQTWSNLNNLTPSDSEAITYDMAAVKEASEDGYALVTNISHWGYSALPAIQFKRAIKADSVTSLSFRMFNRINWETTYGAYDPETGKFVYTDTMNGSQGIYLYSIEASGAKGEGILVNPLLKDGEWVEYVICGETLAKLADAHGYISGFALASGMVINGDLKDMLAPNEAYDLGNTVMIDSVTAYNHHIAGDWVEDEGATCIANGSKHKECIGCGTVLETGEIEKVGHTFGEWVEEVPATCTEEGTKGHKECEVCHRNFDKDGSKIDDLTIEPAHTFGEWVEEVPATCTVEGVKGHKDCTACNKHFDKDGKEIEDVKIAAAHTFGTWIEEVPATSTEEGVKGHKDCTVCNKHFDKDGKEIEDLKIEKLPQVDSGVSDDGSSSSKLFGCASVVGSGMVLFGCMLLGGAAIVLKKKKDNE